MDSGRTPGNDERRALAVRACRTRLASAGYDLSADNTTENAADIADLRTALKIDNWHVYGVSYGSDLARPCSTPARHSPGAPRPIRTWPTTSPRRSSA
jgi:pimeloyl-ACP methyl ester carboxylesterase